MCPSEDNFWNSPYGGVRWSRCICYGKSDRYMSKLCGHGRWPLVAGAAEGRDCCIIIKLNSPRKFPFQYLLDVAVHAAWQVEQELKPLQNTQSIPSGISAVLAAQNIMEQAISCLVGLCNNMALLKTKQKKTRLGQWPLNYQEAVHKTGPQADFKTVQFSAVHKP